MVSIRYFGPCFCDAPCSVDIPEGATYAALTESIKARLSKAAAAKFSSFVLLLNGERIDDSAFTVKDGDELIILATPMGG